MAPPGIPGMWPFAPPPPPPPPRGPRGPPSATQVSRREEACKQCLCVGGNTCGCQEVRASVLPWQCSAGKWNTWVLLEVVCVCGCPMRSWGLGASVPGFCLPFTQYPLLPFP
eukprot:scaffold303934_cov17-Tisochrysis_lutea.AAC.2